MGEKEFRDAMGKFATGVTVITTRVEGIEHGMTANAFMSVSLQPQLVVISIGVKARMNEYIRQSRAFAVNILSSSQKDVSMQFAGQIKTETLFTFASLDDLPVIPNALAQVACKVMHVYQEGDHTLYIGEVTGLKLSDGEPLLFFSGNYHELVSTQEKTLL